MGNKHTYIIAEMACSHEGDPLLAQKIIDGAGKAGADAIQFQIWSREDMVVPNHSDNELLSRLQLSQDVWAELASYTKTHYPDMEIIACVYEGKSVAFASRIGVDAYKIHSSDLSNPYLLNLVAQTGRRIDLSVGASTLVEIQDAIECIRAASSSEIWLMYGLQTFPTPTDGVHLRWMMKLRDMFELPVGYQDHTDANHQAALWLPACAVGMGVAILEKHITHDRGTKGADHEAALNPDEFATFVEMVRMLDAAKGHAQPKPFTEEEIKYRKYSKKSLVASRHLPSGTRLNEEDLVPMRATELGLPPNQVSRLVGLETQREIKAYDLVIPEDVK